jgi:sugar/nucleoside kinase (ribokinase family)
VIINEIECCSAWNLEAYKPDGTLDRETVKLAMQKMIDGGVSDRVIVHCKQTSFALDTKGNFTEVPSLRIPKELIKGSVGAGDAFCAGCLYGIYNDYSDRQILEFASAAAACNLFEANSVDGMRPRNEILKIAQ